jgi:thiosulfate reductase cytochrome b subunit
VATDRPEDLEMSASERDGGAIGAARGKLVYRQSAWTRATHWLWAICLFFLLLSGLQIFNAHPILYVGDQSGFEFENYVFAITARETDEGLRGITNVLGGEFDTSGVLGTSGGEDRAFPAWATIPSAQDLGTGRVVHFFFAWLLVATLVIWLIASLVNGHASRDLAPRMADLRNLPRDLIDHIKLRLHHARSYNTLQKLAYGGVLFVLFPLMILTGLAMSPGANALMPWLPELLGGRQTARTIHFLVMVLLVGFFVVHMLMILAAGPLNELRSIFTGWYRIDAANGAGETLGD